MKHHRKARPDRLLTPGATKDEIVKDHAAAPFDRVAIEMERMWGVDCLPGLVSPVTAEKYGRAVAHLNDRINEGTPAEVAAAATNCIKGMTAMDAEARSLGRQPITPDVFEYEHEGHHFGIVRDVTVAAIAEAQRPGITIYTMREVAIALHAARHAVSAVKDAFPGAAVTAIRSTIGEDIDDELPY